MTNTVYVNVNFNGKYRIFDTTFADLLTESAIIVYVCWRLAWG
jgi:hypothetical protein